MRIDANHGLQPTPENNRTSASAATPSAAGALGEDQAQLSGAQAQVTALVAQAAQLPEIRQERVSSLRQAVESGRYDPSPESTAGALVTYMLAGSFA
ncbi:MAG TPA: flagellar biosynthesis anti-sigma factor FlgM [Candidatus Solibacter sp.]|nr:flagellar biosynthesis anti-sigma factor FlgM [Candidatus Solibacter sp.]